MGGMYCNRNRDRGGGTVESEDTLDRFSVGVVELEYAWASHNLVSLPGSRLWERSVYRGDNIDVVLKGARKATTSSMCVFSN